MKCRYIYGKHFPKKAFQKLQNAQMKQLFSKFPWACTPPGDPQNWRIYALVPGKKFCPTPSRLRIPVSATRSQQFMKETLNWSLIFIFFPEIKLQELAIFPNVGV